MSRLGDCSDEEFERVDKVRARTYRRLLARLPTREARKALAKSERTWEPWRAAQCDYDAGFVEGQAFGDGGTIRYLIIECYIDMTKRRIVQLRSNPDYW